MGGKGAYTFKNGDNYEGDIKEDKMNGKGTLTKSTGDKYVGEFVDGKPDGEGIFFLMQKAINMKGILRHVKSMDMELRFMLMDFVMMENGNMMKKLKK